jgi:hypothetical protein
MHLSESFSAEYVLAGHGLHVPLAVMYVPGVQVYLVQARAPWVEFVPAGHKVHAVALFSGANVPAVQGMHMDVRFCDEGV